MTPTVSVVIPTIGRTTLERAVRSALDQSHPVLEVLVVGDPGDHLALPDDERVIRVDAGAGSGAAARRQQAIERARGSIIALLDDDDEWYPTKLEHQLAAVARAGPMDGTWVSSTRLDVVGPGDRRRVWPRRLIGPRDSVADYLFRMRQVGMGGALLQSSTLCFPTGLGREIRWDTHAGEIHDEPSWLLEVQRRRPEVRWIHLPEILVAYHVGHASVSRDSTDRSADYIEWGVRFLASEPRRVVGDYLCTSPVSAAVAARSPCGCVQAVIAAVRYGRPGWRGLTYAAANLVRCSLLTIGQALHR